MSRVHLFEWEDQVWFPSLFRDYITDHLRFAMDRLFKPARQKIADAMKATNKTAIVDLCSGGGGPVLGLIPYLTDELGTTVTATLTDLYPNVNAFRKVEEKQHGRVKCRLDSISAFDVPSELSGFRTMFTSFHHFRPSDAKRILTDAATKRVPLAVLEANERTPWMVISTPIWLFIVGLFLTPFVGRLSFTRVLFTYVLPIAPLFFAWDGLVSALRTYSPSELEELTADLHSDGYRWEIGQIKAMGPQGPYRITYLFGFPSKD